MYECLNKYRDEVLSRDDYEGFKYFIFELWKIIPTYKNINSLFNRWVQESPRGFYYLKIGKNMKKLFKSRIHISKKGVVTRVEIWDNYTDKQYHAQLISFDGTHIYKNFKPVPYSKIDKLEKALEIKYPKQDTPLTEEQIKTIEKSLIEYERNIHNIVDDIREKLGIKLRPKVIKPKKNLISNIAGTAGIKLKTKKKSSKKQELPLIKLHV